MVLATALRAYAPYLIAAALGAGAAYWLQGLRWEADVSQLKQAWAEEKRALAEAAQAELQKRVTESQALALRIEDLDRQHARELRDAELEKNRLAAAVRAGERRLFIGADCPGGLPADPGAAGLGDGARRARLDPDAAARLIALTERGDRAIRQLTACQAFITTLRSNQE